MALCNGAPWTSLADHCVREFWAAVVPSTLVIILLLRSVPLPTPARRLLKTAKKPFTNFLTLSEAVALDVGEVPGEDPETIVPLWRGLLISAISLFEALFWSAFGSFALIVDYENIWDSLRPFLIALSWLYATSRPFIRPTATPPFDLVTLFAIQLIFGVLTVGGIIYDVQVQDIPAPDGWVIAGHLFNLLAVSSLLLLVLSMPLAIPGKRIDKEEIVRVASSELLFYQVSRVR